MSKFGEPFQFALGVQISVAIRPDLICVHVAIAVALENAKVPPPKSGRFAIAVTLSVFDENLYLMSSRFNAVAIS